MLDMEKLLYTEIGPLGKPYKKGDWKEFAIHNDKEIKGFFGEYRFLSNFWPAIVVLDNIIYKSTEIAYQASKWSPDERDYFLSCTELESIDYNRKNTPNFYSAEEWCGKRVDIMRDLLKQKFDPSVNPDNYEMLIKTGNKNLEELNWWKDIFWGVDESGNGENMLGKLLMEIREELKNRSFRIN
jgi:N-glycosidase YbiA